MTAVYYVETSAILAWLFNQSNAKSVWRLLNATNTVLATSVLTLIEAKRAVRRALVGQTLLKTAEALKALSLLEKTAKSWELCEITTEIQDLASKDFPVEPIRSLDAIHLATAMELLKVHPDLKIMSFDKRLIINAKALGFEILFD